MAYAPRGGIGTPGIHGQMLEINVVGCNNLIDKEWFGRQDPYVVIEYSSSKYRTRTDTDGGKNPSYNEKFIVPLIEGLREIAASVWNSNTFSYDDHIGSTRILLEKVLSSGYDDTAWPLKSQKGKSAGELKLILHYATTKKPDKMEGSSYGAPMHHGYPGQPQSGFAPAPSVSPAAYSPQPCYQPAGYAAAPTLHPPVYMPGHPAAAPSFSTPVAAYPTLAPAPYPAYFPAAAHVYPGAQGYPPAPSGYPPAYRPQPPYY